VILSLVTFVPHRAEPLPAGASGGLFERTAPRYRTVPGLIRKYYIGVPGKRAGGVYEWQSMAHAQAYFTPEWEKFMTDNYGTDLRVEHYEAPCVVDNVAGTITIAPELGQTSKTQAAE
jgi:hypothetical protein